jgi:transposase InsO family protein
MELQAIEPNQVWSWDITWLRSMVKGIFFFAYMIIDIWDKSIIGWEIHEKESDEYARYLFERTLHEEKYPQVSIHSDNGNPMKGISLLSLFYDLGIKNSFSRPRVSNDNPFIESFFGTMKTALNILASLKISMKPEYGWLILLTGIIIVTGIPEISILLRLR